MSGPTGDLHAFDASEAQPERMSFQVPNDLGLYAVIPTPVLGIGDGCALLRLDVGTGSLDLDDRSHELLLALLRVAEKRLHPLKTVDL